MPKDRPLSRDTSAFPHSKYPGLTGGRWHVLCLEWWLRQIHPCSPRPEWLVPQVCQYVQRPRAVDATNTPIRSPSRAANATNTSVRSPSRVAHTTGTTSLLTMQSSDCQKYIPTSFALSFTAADQPHLLPVQVQPVHTRAYALMAPCERSVRSILGLAQIPSVHGVLFCEFCAA